MKMILYKVGGGNRQTAVLLLFNYCLFSKKSKQHQIYALREKCQL